jgi:hypothetical protein
MDRKGIIHVNPEKKTKIKRARKIELSGMILILLIRNQDQESMKNRALRDDLDLAHPHLLQILSKHECLLTDFLINLRDTT